MKYCNVQNNKAHLMALIKWIHDEVLSAGGDGDFLWYSKYYDINDLLPLIEEYNNTLQFKWSVQIRDGILFWEDNQEAVLITNNEEVYKTAPFWQQGLLKY